MEWRNDYAIVTIGIVLVIGMVFGFGALVDDGETLRVLT